MNRLLASFEGDTTPSAETAVPTVALHCAGHSIQGNQPV